MCGIDTFAKFREAYSRAYEFVNYEECKKLIEKIKIKSKRKWDKYWKENERPDNIPYQPDKVYKNKGWISWGDFFGTGTLSPSQRKSLHEQKNINIQQGLDTATDTCYDVRIE